MKLLILHVITTIDLGGAERQLLTVAKCQKEMGSRVKVIFLKDFPKLADEFISAGIEVSFEFAHLKFFEQVIKFRKYAKSLNDWVIHAHLPRAELLCSLALPRNSFVLTRHNSENFFPDAPRVFSRILSRYVLHKAFAGISISHAVYSFLLTNKEISPSKNHFVIPYGMTNTQVSRVQGSFMHNDKFRIGTVSRLVPQKNIPLLLQACKILLERSDIDFELLIVGVGPQDFHLQELSRTLGISRVVKWKGETHNVAEFYDQLDLFVLTSNYEGFGLVLLEAMSKGLPVVARNISAIPEVLGSTHSGLVSRDDAQSFAQKITQVLTDTTLYNNIVNYQALRLNKFSITNTQRQLESLYFSLLTRGRD